MPQAVLDRPGTGSKGDQPYWFSLYNRGFEDKFGFQPGTLQTKLESFAATRLKRKDLTKSEQAEALFCSHQYAEAEATAMWAADEATRGDRSSPSEAVAALGVAGAAAWADNRCDRALQHYRAALALVEKTHDPLGWARLEWRVAFMLDIQGSHKEAARAYRSTCIIFERERGADHPDTLMCFNNLANSLGSCDQAVEAEVIHRRVLAAREAGLFATENPASLTSRSNLAWVIQTQKRYAEAEKELRIVLLGRQRLLGSEHADTLQSRTDLGDVLALQEKYREALEQYSIALPILKRTQGEWNIRTMLARSGMADIWCAQEKYAAAEREYRAVLVFLDRTWGPEHPDSMQIRSSFGVSLLYQGKYQEAGRLFTVVLASREAALGATHPDMLAASCYLALCLEGEGRLREALPLAQRTEAAWEKTASPGDAWVKYAKSVRKRVQDRLAEKE
jgi:tetratricopeptide (TPR) repeat protein